jgi:hypothetical protein
LGEKESRKNKRSLEQEKGKKEDEKKNESDMRERGKDEKKKKNTHIHTQRHSNSSLFHPLPLVMAWFAFAFSLDRNL